MYNTITNQNDEIYVTDMNEMLTLDALTKSDLDLALENYLPLTAGSSKPLTDVLYVDGGVRIASEKNLSFSGEAVIVSSGVLRIGTPSNINSILVATSDYFIPGTNGTTDLGRDTNRWNNIYGTNIYQNGKQVANKEDLQNINMSDYLPLVAGADNSLTGDLYTSGEINLDIGKSLNWKTSIGTLHNLITYSNGGYIFVGENDGSDIVSGSNIIPSTGSTNGCNLGSSNEAWNAVYCNEIYQGGEKVPTKNEILTSVLKIATNEDIDKMFN